MTATRLHIARIPAAIGSPEAQARQLAAALTPSAPVWVVGSLDEAWPLAEFVDLVDAGYGEKNARYRGACQALTQFVRRNWQDPACRTMCGRSAYLARAIERVLDEGAQAGGDVVEAQSGACAA